MGGFRCRSLCEDAEKNEPGVTRNVRNGIKVSEGVMGVVGAGRMLA